MGLIKNKNFQNEDELIIESTKNAISIFENENIEQDKRIIALEYMIKNEDVVFVLDELLKISDNNEISTHPFIDHVFTYFKHKPKRDEDFDRMLKMLQSQNVYLRNMVIKYLQEYGEDAKKFIKKLMDNDDKDLRIFAINILGDVSFEDSIEMLRYFIALEADINAMMTAIDYLGEVGSEEDIELLESVKNDNKDNDYVIFGVDMAIERIRG